MTAARLVIAAAVLAGLVPTEANRPGWRGREAAIDQRWPETSPGRHATFAG
jgi:hypothetical protein